MLYFIEDAITLISDWTSMTQNNFHVQYANK